MITLIDHTNHTCRGNVDPALMNTVCSTPGSAVYIQFYDTDRNVSERMWVQVTAPFEGKLVNDPQRVDMAEGDKVVFTTGHVVGLMSKKPLAGLTRHTLDDIDQKAERIAAEVPGAVLDGDVLTINGRSLTWEQIVAFDLGPAPAPPAMNPVMAALLARTQRSMAAELHPAPTTLQ